MFLNDSEYTKLCIISNRLASYYYSPIYLVGSSLTTEYYNDVDVVAVLSDKNFERRYGSIQQYILENNKPNNLVVRNRWAIDCYKRWEIISDFTGLNIDFKTQPKSISLNHKGKPFLRLDSMINFN